MPLWSVCRPKMGSRRFLDGKDRTFSEVNAKLIEEKSGSAA